MLVASSRLPRNNFKTTNLIKSIECDYVKWQRCVYEKNNWNAYTTGESYKYAG